MPTKKNRIAVVGSGIAGLSAAWLLSKGYTVDLYEKDDRLGGHSNTVDTPDGPIDTGFIVYNPLNYPNLVNFFNQLGVDTCRTDMSFGVSVDRGKVEYAGRDLKGLFAQKSNLVRPSFWRMVKDLLRFYREAPLALKDETRRSITLGAYLEENGYSRPFIENHLIPMGAAIWSTPVAQMMDYPLMSFVSFCDNHGLLRLNDRPQWRTVIGGSRQYVDKTLACIDGVVRLNTVVKAVRQGKDGVEVESLQGCVRRYDHVVLACHGDQALGMLSDATPDERAVLGRFRYQRNRAILHTDRSLMPRRRDAWCSWNYLTEKGADSQELCVTYWMNNLQPIEGERDYFVTLNPIREPRAGTIERSFLYDHPIFDLEAEAAQKALWSLQGKRGIWFCGSYLGFGFHEDGIQSGLAVAEAIGPQLRPWDLPENNRINLPQDWLQRRLAKFQEAAAA